MTAGSHRGREVKLRRYQAPTCSANHRIGQQEQQPGRKALSHACLQYPRGLRGEPWVCVCEVPAAAVCNKFKREIVAFWGRMSCGEGPI